MGARPRHRQIRPSVHRRTRHAAGRFKGGLIGVTLAANMDEATALAARIACQSIDKALRRHLERGGDSDTPEMLTGIHIGPMGDIRDARP